MQSDIKILEVEASFTPLKFRTPLKFGAVVVEDTAYSQVRVKVENHRGEAAEGFGGILLSDGWAWPSKVIEHQQREETMKEMTKKLCRLFASYKEFGHPIEIFFNLEEKFKRINKEVCNKLTCSGRIYPTHGLDKSSPYNFEMPFLGALICASPIDAALHDAFGKVNEISVYNGYGREFMSDLSPWLGEEFKGKYIADYLRKEYLPRIPVFHLVGGLDKLRKNEVDESDIPADGLPNSLEEWIEKDGLTCLKIKLKGNDLNWDIRRVLEIVKLSHEIKTSQNRGKLFFSGDTNEQCESPEYLVEMLNKIKEKSPRAFEEILYFEQPTERDLNAHAFDLHKLSQIKPILLDESLVNLENFERAKELGWSGISLKTCKGQSASLILMAKASEEKIPYSVQDLTNPKLSLIQSIGLAARINPIKGVEANARQFIPFASEKEERVHPELFQLKDGEASTKTLQGPGLGYQIGKIG